ncbi:hypothetical protein GQ457_02G008650 [Hibiscus cannabinus]
MLVLLFKTYKATLTGSLLALSLLRAVLVIKSHMQWRLKADLAPTPMTASGWKTRRTGDSLTLLDFGYFAFLLADIVHSPFLPFSRARSSLFPMGLKLPRWLIACLLVSIATSA